MTNYETLKTYKKRLRNIIFLSADVQPKQVATYLKQIATHTFTDAAEEALEAYPQLIKYIAKDYVDLALSELLVRKPRKPKKNDRHDIIRWSSSLSMYYDHLGIRERIRCFPPAHIQGPFLYLLHHDEQEGLRLIHTLVNKAIGVWRQREQDPSFLGKSRIPVPVILQIPSGQHTLWGDERVYSWYRPSVQAPDIVISALMALEVWMEEQITAGKNPGELFGQILSSSDCVAVAGICLSISLAFPEQCLHAALPLLASPAIWRLDAARVARDQQPPIRISYYEYKLIYDACAERDHRPQRQRALPFLAGYYMANDSLKMLFEQSVGRFSQAIPFLFEDEQDDPEFSSSLAGFVKQIQACGESTNYRHEQVDGRTQMRFDPPQPPAQETEKVSASEEPSDLTCWIRQTLQEGKPAKGLTTVEAIREIQERSQNQHIPSWLFPAMAATALLTDFQKVQKHELIPWCCEHLLSVLPPKEHIALFYTYPAHASNSIVDLAVKGLVMLVVHNEATEEVRETLLSFIALPYADVRAIILQHLDAILKVDETLCWNILSLAISLHLVPRQLAVQAAVKRYNTGVQSEDILRWEENVIETHLETLKLQIIPALPRIPTEEETCYLWNKEEETFHALPIAALCALSVAAKTQLLQLISDLLVWTFAVNHSSPEYAYVLREPHPIKPYEWNRFFLPWIVRTMDALSQAEMQRFILIPILEQWDISPHLVKDLIYHYTQHTMNTPDPLPPSSLETWRFLCNWILSNDKLVPWANGFSLEDSVSDIVGDIVFVGLPSKWPHALLFSGIIEKWVNIIGGNAAAYSSLLKFLSRSGASFVPDPALRWISHCVFLNPQRLLFWQTRKNAERTARLLQHMWDQDQEKIRTQSTLLRMYTDLVDQLVGMGVPLASILQQHLEQHR